MCTISNEKIYNTDKQAKDQNNKTYAYNNKQYAYNNKNIHTKIQKINDYIDVKNKYCICLQLIILSIYVKRF